MTDAQTNIETLAIDGGTPIRAEPLPWELPGAHWIGAEERDLVLSVVEARSPFRYYGLDPQHCVDRLEAAWAEKFGHKHRPYPVKAGRAPWGCKPWINWRYVMVGRAMARLRTKSPRSSIRRRRLKR